MKVKIFTSILFLYFLSITHAIANDALAEKFANAIKTAGQYALTEMRPTASFDDISLERIRQSEPHEGGDIKARVSAYWTTAFTKKSRTMVIDIWLSVEGSEIYMTRYKLYSDDHNVPIMNKTDMKTRVRVSNMKSTSDDF